MRNTGNDVNYYLMLIIIWFVKIGLNNVQVKPVMTEVWKSTLHPSHVHKWNSSSRMLCLPKIKSLSLLILVQNFSYWINLIALEIRAGAVLSIPLTTRYCCQFCYAPANKIVILGTWVTWLGKCDKQTSFLCTWYSSLIFQPAAMSEILVCALWSMVKKILIMLLNFLFAVIRALGAVSLMLVEEYLQKK